MTDTLPTTPARAALSQRFAASVAAAGDTVTALHADLMTYVACLIRDTLPTAAAITVNTEDNALYEVRDAQGKTLWYEPVSAGHDFHDGLVDDVDDLFMQALPFGGLAGAGWTVAPEGDPFRMALLPDPQTAELESSTRLRHGGSTYTLTVRVAPEASPALNILDSTGEPMRETRDRIRAALVNQGFSETTGAVTVTLDGPAPSPALDLAIACTVLAVEGGGAPFDLERIAVIGEAGLDGKVRPVRDINEAVSAARANGYRTAIIAEADMDAVDVPGIGLHGAKNISEALVLLSILAPRA